MARPTDYTEELAKDICQQIVEGKNLNVISKEDKYPNASTLYKWLLERKEFSTMYARAREGRADARSDRVDGYVRETIKGEMQPDVARVAIDAEKWQAGKESSKYGDKSSVEISGKDGGAIEHKNMTDEEIKARIIELTNKARATGVEEPS